jgi:hypothetical protein
VADVQEDGKRRVGGMPDGKISKRRLWANVFGSRSCVVGGDVDDDEDDDFDDEEGTSSAPRESDDDEEPTPSASDSSLAWPRKNSPRSPESMTPKR